MLIIFLITILTSSNILAENFRYEFQFPTAHGSLSTDFELSLSPFCKSSAEQYLTVLSNYLSNTLRKAKKLEGDFQALKKFEKTLSPSCKVQVLELKPILSSMFIMASQPYNYALKTIRFLAFIQRQHIIKLLTSDIRSKYSALKSKRVMGAYSCGEDIIWIDNTRRPLNIGTVLIHELEHWAAARLRGAQDFKSLDSKSIYLLEEFVSSINSSLAQLFLRNNSNRSRNSPRKVIRPRRGVQFSREGFTFFSNKRNFVLKDDLNLYSKRGMLHKSWRKIVRRYGVDFDTNYSEYLINHFLDFEKDNQETSLAIISLIEKVYFGKDSAASKNVLDFLTAQEGISLTTIDPLGWVITQGNTYWTNIGKPSCPPANFPFPGGEGAGMSDDEVRLSNYEIKACIEPHGDL